MAEKITQKVEGQLSKSQKEFLLRQQVTLCVSDIFFYILRVDFKFCHNFLWDKGNCQISGNICCFKKKKKLEVFAVKTFLIFGYGRGAWHRVLGSIGSLSLCYLPKPVK